MQRCEAMHASRATRARLVTKKVRAAQSNRNACTVTERPQQSVEEGGKATEASGPPCSCTVYEGIGECMSCPANSGNLALITKTSRRYTRGHCTESLDGAGRTPTSISTHNTDRQGRKTGCMGNLSALRLLRT